MTIDDAILELESIRARHGGGTTLPEWAAESVRAAGFATSPPLPASSPLFARLPTSDEFARYLLPKVRSVVRARKPLASIVLMPILAVVIRIVLQIVWMEVAKWVGGLGGAAAPGGRPMLPWADEPGDIPEDIQRAARMEV